MEFADDGDGTGQLRVEAAVEGFSGRSAAYFNISELQRFARAISEFPLPDGTRCQITGGFLSRETRRKLDQEHLGIDVYPINRRGHIAVHVRMATQLWQGDRVDSQRIAKLEIITRYDPLEKFSTDMLALLKGSVREATLEGETID